MEGRKGVGGDHAPLVAGKAVHRAPGPVET